MGIFKWLDDLPFVRATRVLLAEQDSSRRHLKMEILLTDGSTLFTNEYVATGIRKYAFHWQAADGLLLARWDNAPHYPSLPTFPHHLHRGEVVEPGREVTLEDVLLMIAEWQQAKEVG